MIFSTLLSFLGGSAFRMLWGEISSLLTARQEHNHEIQRMQVQGLLDAEQHSRHQEAIRLQAELGVKTIQVQGEVDLSRLDADIFSKGVELTGKTTGMRWVDAWNAVIRPMLATGAMILVGLHFYRAGWTLDARGWELVGAILGLFLADRALFKRGK